MEQLKLKGVLSFLMIMFCTMVFTYASAQQKTISGTVTDNSGARLPGATVVVKGTTQGTITNNDGAYTLPVNQDAGILVFSYIGMLQQEVKIENLTTINVTLQPDVIGIEEVIAVGYATRRAGEVTGAVSSVNSSAIEVMPVIQSSEILRTVSGVTVMESNTPGEGASIRIRGLGTINDNNPLWVVDGVPGGSVSPNNIESISVLKDASSQAIYGARAANGVILVTTKSGRKNQKAQVNINVKNGFKRNVNYYDLLNTREYGEMLWLQAKNDGIANFSHPQYGSGPTPDIPEYIRPARGVNVDHSLYDDKMIHEDGTDTYLIMKANQEGTDWLREASRDAQFQEYTVDLGGGSQNTMYAFQLGYLLEEGILKFTGYDRFNIRSNVTSNLAPWLEIGEKLGVTYTRDYGHQTDNAESSIISWAYRMPPIVPVFDIAGNYAGTRASGTGNSSNPIFLLDANKDDMTKRMNVSGNTYIKLTPIKGLSMQSLFGVDYTARHFRNPGFVEKAHAERGKFNTLGEETSFGMQWNWTNTIEYKNIIADAHNFTILIGTEAVDYNYNYVNASREDFSFADLNYMQLATGLQGINNDGNMNSWSLYSQFGRINYAYNNKYFLEGVVRRDGSSRFGGTNPYGIFPAASVGWRISEENFMASTNNWLDELKLRVGYGETGNDRVGNYNSYTTFGIHYFDSFYPITGVNVGTGTTGFYQRTFGNPNVKWEATQTTNLGVDATIGKNFNLSFDIWRRNTVDMLYPKQIPHVLGQASAPSVNVGEMLNKGFDIEVGYFNSSANGDFNFGVDLYFSHYKNEIVQLSGKEGEFLSGSGYREMVYTRSETGTSFPEFHGYIVEGIFQTQAEADAHPKAFGAEGTYNQPGHYKYKDVNGDKIINADDRTYIGSPHPDFTAGMNLNLSYKGFSVVTQIYSSYGNEMVNYVSRFIDFVQFQGGRSHDRLYNSWGSPYLADNTKAKLPKAEGNDIASQQPSSAFVEDASYLRMKNLRVGYDFNKLFGIRNMQVYGQVTNVFTLTNYSGLDPEVNSSGRNMGIDSGAWPTPRQFMVGLNIGI
jgi:TonB-dependent starch-binding outer membrane protein SusC